MPTILVTLNFHSGFKRHLFQNVRLSGSWDAAGIFSSQWSQVSMRLYQDSTGCDAFSATVSFDPSQVNTTFQWGVFADLPGAADSWVIVTEIADASSSEITRGFVLGNGGGQVDYWFVTGRRVGAQKYYEPGATKPGIGFSVWAPYAQAVEVVFAPPFAAQLTTETSAMSSGYIDDQGGGIDPTAPVIALTRHACGIWEANPASTAVLSDFNAFMNRLYMYRVTTEQGIKTYKADIFARNQVGKGNNNPGGTPYTGTYLDLDGIVSCSVVSDPDRVTEDFNDTGIQKQSLVSADEFWAAEFDPAKPLPKAISDLIIYELHIGSLGYPSLTTGTFADAMTFLSELVDLGVNAVELLPVLESDGDLQWGYGTSLFFCLQTSQGGANQLKHFVRACHQQGIAVIMDVVYNHYTTSGGERSEWGYDSDPNIAPQHNIWNWYEGLPSDYPGDISGGYLNNGSSGFTPGFQHEFVRQMFTSSAAALFDDFHIDGIRVDLTDAIHQNNTLNVKNGRSVGCANQYGAKLLRELARTVRILKPEAFLIAEDYTGWTAMTQPVDQGGIGFNAVWYMDFYHNLIGDGNYGTAYANLLKTAGLGGNGALNMDAFAGALLATQYDKLVYHESHDEAGNDANTARTIVTAVNFAPLYGPTRTYAEARCRFAFGMAALSAGTAMFFMGEEVGASNPFTTATFAANKVDFIGQKAGNGRFLYVFYQSLITFVRKMPAARANALDVIYRHDVNRVIAFTRSAPSQNLLVIASLNNTPFSNGYVLETDSDRLPSGDWREIFNSDSSIFGGSNIGNGGATLQVINGQITVVLPANGFVVLQKI